MESRTARLRAAALAPLQRLVRDSGETANLSIRTGDRVRFIASVECEAELRVSSREGMVFPVERTSGGTVLLAALSDDEAERGHHVRAASYRYGDRARVGAHLLERRGVVVAQHGGELSGR